ncbi:MAG: LVIVD repeat-containing protein [Promethearchaeota archaeon]
MKDHKKLLLILLYAVIIPGALGSYFLSKSLIPWVETQPISNYPETKRSPSDFVRDGENLYIAENNYGIKIIDISNSSAPIMIANWTLPDYIFSDIGLEGNRIYLTMYKLKGYEPSSLLILDRQDINNITIIGNYTYTEAFEKFEVKDDIVYMASYQNLIIFNATDPSNIQILSSVFGHFGEHGVAIQGNYVFFANNWLGLYVFDASNKSAPILVNQLITYATDDIYSSLNRANDVIIQGNFAFLLDEFHGLIIFDITDINNISKLSRYSKGGIITDIKMEGDKLYCADSVNGIDIISISDPYNPQQLGVGQFLSKSVTIDKIGSKLYVLDEYGLNIVETSYKNRFNPQEMQIAIKVIEAILGVIAMLTLVGYLFHKINHAKILE